MSDRVTSLPQPSKHLASSCRVGSLLQLEAVASTAATWSLFRYPAAEVYLSRPLWALGKRSFTSTNKHGEAPRPLDGQIIAGHPTSRTLAPPELHLNPSSFCSSRSSDDTNTEITLSLYSADLKLFTNDLAKRKAKVKWSWFRRDQQTKQ